MMIVRWLVALHLIAMSGVASAQTEAPLGLTWGQSATQVRALGVELKDFTSEDFGKSYLASSLPRALADQDVTILSFGHDDRLWRAAAVGRKNDHDPSGASIKSRYDELRHILEEKYGRATSTHRLGDSIYAKSENFVYGLSTGNSYWYSDFSTPTVEVQLAITALDLSSSRWRIIFEDKGLRTQFQSSKKLREKKAL